MNKDLEKAERIWEAMNEAVGASLPFPAQQIEDVLAAEARHMAEEDPDRLIPCHCHGELTPSRDVDVWGLCPYGRGEL